VVHGVFPLSLYIESTDSLVSKAWHLKMLQLFMCIAMHSTSKYVGGNKNYNDTRAYMYILCRVDRAHRRNHQKGRHATRGQPTSAPFTTVRPPDDAAARTAFAVATNGGIVLEIQVGV